MSRWFAWGWLILVAAGFAGCNGGSSQQPVAATAAETTAEKGSTELTQHSGAEQSGNDPVTDASETPTEPDAEASAAEPNPAAAEDSQQAAKSSAPKTAPVATRRTPTRPGEAEQITFDDLNCGMQADIQFRPWMLTERVKELEGQKVRVAGYMHPDAKQKGITEFILLRNTECKFGPSGQADHLIRVKLKEGVTTSYSISPIEVTGVITVNPFEGPDGNTWSIFDLTGEEVGAPRR